MEVTRTSHGSAPDSVPEPQRLPAANRRAASRRIDCEPPSATPLEPAEFGGRQSRGERSAYDAGAAAEGNLRTRPKRRA